MNYLLIRDKEVKALPDQYLEKDVETREILIERITIEETEMTIQALLQIIEEMTKIHIIEEIVTKKEKENKKEIEEDQDMIQDHHQEIGKEGEDLDQGAEKTKMIEKRMGLLVS